MHACIGEPQAGLAQTESLDGGVPELGDRDAVQECTNHSPSAVDGKDSDHDPADDAHAVRGEYSEVLQEDRGFGAKNGGIVEGNGEPKGLEQNKLDITEITIEIDILPSAVARGSWVGCP